MRTDNLITHFRSNLFFLKESEIRFFLDENLENEDIFFDVGANIGMFSMYAAIKKNATVYAFEPEYSNLNLLKENIIKNNLTSQIRPYSLAVGNECKVTKLHIADLTPGAAVSSISKKILTKTHEGYDVVWQEGVMEVTLDKITSDLNVIPKVLKIDTDGNEKNVLLGAKNIICSDKLKFIIIEKTKNKSDLLFCYKFLEDLGYQEINKSDKVNMFWKKKTNSQIIYFEIFKSCKFLNISFAIY